MSDDEIMDNDLLDLLVEELQKEIYEIIISQPLDAPVEFNYDFVIEIRNDEETATDQLDFDIL